MDLFERIDTTSTNARRRGQAHLNRLLGLADLSPKIPEEAFKEVVAEELDDQRCCLARAFGRAGSGTPVWQTEVLDALERAPRGSFPRDVLVAARSSAGDDEGRLESAIGRFDRFERRLGWLLRPSTFDEVQRLDPVADANQIFHYISYEFRIEQKLFSVLFETRPFIIPFAAMMFYSTGEFRERSFRRINDTVMFFSNLMEWGLESKRGRDAIEHLNTIHGRYSIANETFLFILGNVMFVPGLWNERLGWRRFTEVERLGWFHAFVEMGRAMNIQGVTDDFDSMKAQWEETSDRYASTSAVGRNGFVEILLQVLATYPVELRRPITTALLVGMDETFREALDFPPPDPQAVEDVRTTLRTVGQVSASMPRVPWARSLQLHPLYRSVEQIGVDDRSAYLPRMVDSPRGCPNAGYPTGVKPLERVEDAPTPELPTVSSDELATHATPDDAWIAIDGIVYDVTRFLFEHPGGAKAIMPFLGTDASAAYHRVGHTEAAQIMAINFQVGRLELEAGPGRSDVRPHSTQRAGRNKIYSDNAFEETLRAVEELAQQYVDQSVRRDRPKTTRFRIVLPFDPRPSEGPGKAGVPPSAEILHEKATS